MVFASGLIFCFTRMIVTPIELSFNDAGDEGLILFRKKLQKKKLFGQQTKELLSGGEEGIRTPVTIAGKHIFETCAIIHSATSPDVRNYIRFFSFRSVLMSELFTQTNTHIIDKKGFTGQTRASYGMDTGRDP